MIRIIILFVGATCWAQGSGSPGKGNPNSLFFPFEKNHVQILPQRFEYELLDKDQFRIGNAQFDARLFEFNVSDKANENGERKIQVRWPAALLTTGEISIRDNIGKSLWTTPIAKSTAKMVKKQQGSGSTLVASAEGAMIPERVFNLIFHSPYFRVCIQKADQLTRIAICSKDFYFGKLDGKSAILSRDSDRSESYVNINGNKVDPVGLIFLQGVSNVISLRVLLLSGAQIEVDTRLKKVDFRDMYLSQDGERLVVSAFGAEPVAGQKVLRMADGSWQTEVGINRPVIYLKGEGDIPMKQEFVTEGTIRKQQIRVEAEDPLPKFTYSNRINIRLKKTPQYKLATPDEMSKLEEREDSYSWTLLNLTDGVRNRRLVRVSMADETFMAAWEIERNLPWHVRASLGFPFMARVQFERWFDNQHLGLGGEFEHNFTGSKDGDRSAQRMKANLYWSIPEHVNMKDVGWGLLVSPQTFTFDTAKTQGVYGGLFYRAPMNKNLKFLGNYYQVETELFGTGFGDPKLMNSFMLRSEFYYQVEGPRYWFWGFETRGGRLTPGNEFVKKTEFNGGLSLVF